MRKFFLAIAALAVVTMSTLPAFSIQAQTASMKPGTIKTRLDHLSGTQWVVVISYLSSEITSITCGEWTMLGVNSWKHHNDFTIPAGPSIAVMDASKFQGYCKEAGSIVAHTDDGDFVGTLDRGAGNWDASTKLTIAAKAQ